MKVPAMPAKKNPLKLNKLQLRTLALVHVLAADEDCCRKDEQSGEVELLRLPHAHGDHVHVGQFTVTGKDASGLSNPAVWTALVRKGLVRRDDMGKVTVTVEGLAYETGLADLFLQASDH